MDAAAQFRAVSPQRHICVKNGKRELERNAYYHMDFEVTKKVKLSNIS